MGPGLGLGFSGGAGVAINVFFDAVIALSIAVGLGLHRANAYLSSASTSSLTRLRVMTVLSLSLCFGIVIHVPSKAYRMAQILPKLPSIELETKTDIAYLEGFSGPVFCESAALCYWAEKRYELDPFFSRQSFLAGDLDESMLLDKVRSGFYDAIQLATWHEDRDDERMSNSFIETLYHCYRIERVSVNGAFFRPLSEACDPGDRPGPDTGMGRKATPQI